MLPSNHWAHTFAVEPEDIEFLTSLLLEKETPLTSQQLAMTLIEHRLQQEQDALEERYKDALAYLPSSTYQVGQRLVFPHLEYATAIVTGLRPGVNPDYGDFNVIQVEFEHAPSPLREFAAGFTLPHRLNQAAETMPNPALTGGTFSLEQVLKEAEAHIIEILEQELRAQDELIYMARTWFPRDLLLDVNEGHLNLAEAVLDIAGGGPLSPQDIVEQIGGLGSAPLALQVFSLNYRLNEDDRFDEVGPTGEVLWYLTRLEPKQVLTPPSALRYTTIEYDHGLIAPSAVALEREIDDELSDFDAQHLAEGSFTLTYPHRRLGTLPLNSQTRTIFPTARRAPRIWITLIDGQDDAEYIGWVVPTARYVWGLADFYTKHKLPIGAQITVSRAAPGKLRIDFTAYRPRTEYIRLIVPKGDSITFESQKRPIGAAYDELMILGVDDLSALDETIATIQQQRKSLVAILRLIVPALCKLTPQGTAHAKTIYSAINVLRRYPPGPVFATLEANPDFINVGGDYWKLRDE